MNSVIRIDKKTVIKIDRKYEKNYFCDEISFSYINKYNRLYKMFFIQNFE